MTNALAQNIETKNTNAADILMQAVNVSTTSKAQEDSASKFSNFMNNLESRTQKAQNEFDQKAKVTNTSSVNRKVLENCGVNPDEWTGFAFGLGLDRIAMLKNGVNNIHILYDGDVRALKQFKD